MAQAPSPNSSKLPGALDPVVTREQLEEDLMTVFVHFIRAAQMLIGEDSAAAGFVHKALEDAPDLSGGADDLGLVFADIAHAEFVQAFLAMYDFAYFGRFQADAEDMGDETSYTRAAAFVFDLTQATLPVEILQDGAPIAAQRLTQVAETANARHILEDGYESFFHFSRGNEADIGYRGELTVRQMALLAGMTEMTVRTLANPKRADALKTISVDGRTRIEPEVAREWLKRKGKYVRVHRVWAGANVDLAAAKLISPDDLTALLNLRLKQLGDETPGGTEALCKRLGSAKPPLPCIQTIRGPYLDLRREHFIDAKAVAALATILDLPARLITLRARELIAKEDLAQAQRELEVLRKASKEEGRAQ